jgi:hypothetical protein
VSVADIVTRLRRWTHAVDAAPVSDLMDEAADAIDSLRQEVRTQRMEIAGLREERRAILEADRPRVDDAICDSQPICEKHRK